MTGAMLRQVEAMSLQEHTAHTDDSLLSPCNRAPARQGLRSRPGNKRLQKHSCDCIEGATTDFIGLETAPRLANATMDDIDALEVDEEELALSSPLRKRSKSSSKGLHTPIREVQAPGLIPDGWPGLSALQHAVPTRASSIWNENSSFSPPFPAGRPGSFSNVKIALAAHVPTNALQHGPSGRPGTPLPCISVWGSHPCSSSPACLVRCRRTFWCGSKRCNMICSDPLHT